MDAILRSIGILQQMSIGKFLQRKNIFVLMVNNNLNQQLPLQHHQQGQLITIKNHGPILNQNQKMSNSCELLTGLIQDFQRKYEIVSDIVIVEYNGKVHGSQRERFKYWHY